MLTLGSLFDGIGTWQLSARRNGIKPLWSCEIDPYPSAVSHYHFPETKQYGDIKEIHGDSIEPVDIICAGSPCQDLSLAGNRNGFNGDRSSLFLEATRVFHEMRNATHGKYPRFFVWENVTGALSSTHGNDFRAVLEEIGQSNIPMPRKWATCGLARLPQCDIAWRVIDAQYWGSPNVAVESSLSQILQPQDDVPQKYFLSKRGCLGILRRAAAKNKVLPTELEQALKEQSM